MVRHVLSRIEKHALEKFMARDSAHGTDQAQGHGVWSLRWRDVSEAALLIYRMLAGSLAMYIFFIAAGCMVTTGTPAAKGRIEIDEAVPSGGDVEFATESSEPTGTNAAPERESTNREDEGIQEYNEEDSWGDDSDEYGESEQDLDDGSDGSQDLDEGSSYDEEATDDDSEW